jgi:bifunctional UDP-N-acetylglucosamine pyrophosphorylase/glucosamine-1-phosphate N-acetyltransferase
VEIGDGAFIGCNTNLIAPVKIGNGAYIAAGSTITNDVEADAFAIARVKQENKAGYAKKLKEKHGGKENVE